MKTERIPFVKPTVRVGPFVDCPQKLRILAIPGVQESDRLTLVRWDLSRTG